MIDHSGHTAATSRNSTGVWGIRLLKVSCCVLSALAVFPYHYVLDMQVLDLADARPQYYSVGELAEGISAAIVGLAALAGLPVGLCMWRRAKAPENRPGPVAHIGVIALTLGAAYVLALPFLADRIPWPCI